VLAPRLPRARGRRWRQWRREGEEAQRAGRGGGLATPTRGRPCAGLCCPRGEHAPMLRGTDRCPQPPPFCGSVIDLPLDSRNCPSLRAASWGSGSQDLSLPHARGAARGSAHCPEGALRGTPPVAETHHSRAFPSFLPLAPRPPPGAHRAHCQIPRGPTLPPQASPQAACLPQSPGMLACVGPRGGGTPEAYRLRPSQPPRGSSRATGRPSERPGALQGPRLRIASSSGRPFLPPVPRTSMGPLGLRPQAQVLRICAEHRAPPLLPCPRQREPQSCHGFSSRDTSGAPLLRSCWEGR